MALNPANNIGYALGEPDILTFNIELFGDIDVVSINENTFDFDDIEALKENIEDIIKKDLAEKAGISNASIAKLGRNENVNTDILLKICVALKCDIEDILEIVPDESE